MCLDLRREIHIEHREAFKIFHVDGGGGISSAFKYTYCDHRRYCNKINNEDLIQYKTNEMITVVPYHNTFFALVSYQDALSVVDDWCYWSFRSKSLVVLPVTLTNVVATGFLTRQNYHSIKEIKYESYEAKSMTIHDNEENRDKFEVDLRNFKVSR